ncbi:MAG: enoyl-ACP reductase FabI [Nocardioides sp.]
MGILDGKRILVAGVTMDNSIGFAVAKTAQEQGATVLISNFGRALGITRRIAKRLPSEPPVLELDVTDESHLAGLEEAVREHVDGLDGVVHSIAFGNPETLLGGKFMGGPWPDVAQAVQVSAYSLMSLSHACRPLMGEGGAIVGMTFDATVAWPAYDWMGVAKAGLESCSRYLARDLGPRGVRVNLVSAGPLGTLAARGIPGFGDLADAWQRQAPLGWDTEDPAPVAGAVLFLLSDLARAITGEVLHVDGGFHAMGTALVPSGEAAAERELAEAEA